MIFSIEKSHIRFYFVCAFSLLLFFSCCEMNKLSSLLLLIAFLVSVNGAYKIKSKIVNGKAAAVSQFPYYAHLEIFNRDGSGSSCGATLISNEWLLTAAHCTFYAKNIIVHLGMSRLPSGVFSSIEGYTFLSVGEGDFYEHPDYNERLYWNDIALIKLSTEVKFSNYIQPVRLPTSCNVPTKTEIYAMGNGMINTIGDVSKQLLFATLQTIPVHVCWWKYPILFLRQSFICAIDKSENLQSVCMGDSGGPLVTKTDGTLIGVTAFVAQGKTRAFSIEIIHKISFPFSIHSKTEGCDADKPQIFTNLISHLAWIKENTGLDLPNC